MTSLQIFSSLIGLLLYPYLIRKLGAEVWGQYVFLLSIVVYFIDFTNFGFQLTGLKLIAENLDNRKKKSEILSGITSAKFYLALLSVTILFIIVLLVPRLQKNILLMGIIFGQITAEILFPQWYFRAIQQMRVVTLIQLFFRILSVPLIFLFVKTPADLKVYAIITTLTVVLPSFFLLRYLIRHEKLRIRLVNIKRTIVFTREAFPIFISSFIETVKIETPTLIIGLILGMREVALFDLGKKIIMLPRMLLANVNVALFPKLREDPTPENIKRLIKYEWYLGFAMIAAIILLGYPAIYILGGNKMVEAYPISILMSITLMSWLIVGAYIYHILIPNGLNYYITMINFVSLVSFGIFLIPGIFFYSGIYFIIIPLVLSAIIEIIFSKKIIKKKRLL